MEVALRMVIVITTRCVTRSISEPSSSSEVWFTKLLVDIMIMIMTMTMMVMMMDVSQSQQIQQSIPMSYKEKFV